MTVHCTSLQAWVTRAAGEWVGAVTLDSVVIHTDNVDLVAVRIFATPPGNERVQMISKPGSTLKPHF
jgi:hypothetical protein